jgi:hypothetical protein
MPLNISNLRLLITAFFLFVSFILSTVSGAKSISELSQHFNEPGGDISPWMFVPGENIKEMSTTEHPGVMAIWENGKGQDIKGILKDPIRIDDFQLPWEFQLSLTQNFDAMLGVGVKTQANYAIGLNVAVTFSDPSTWPADRAPPVPSTVIFEDHFDSASYVNNSTIDTGVWNWSGYTGSEHGHPNFLDVDETDGDGNYSIGLHGDTNSLATTWIRSIQSFTRGDNLRVTFRHWGDSTDTRHLHAYPNYASIAGPWHADGVGMPEGGLSFYKDSPTHSQQFSENGQWDSGNWMSVAFTAAYDAATSRANSMLIRVWLGDVKGSAVEWSSDEGATWTMEYDSRGQDTAYGQTTGSANTVRLGFAGCNGRTEIDDIVVEIDGAPPPSQPHDMRWFQLLVVHLGTTGMEGLGLPQYTTLPTPETYLVWGRGDFGLTVRGDWQIPNIWVGDGVRRSGPASDQLYFRAKVLNSTTLEIGFRFDQSHPFNMRRIDCSRYGKITGIWEIGPVFSCDRWIPDTLCRYLPWKRGGRPMGELIGDIDEKGKYSTKYIKLYETSDPEPPNPKYAYYIDYCVFSGRGPASLEEFSDDFNIPGCVAKWQASPHGATIDTHNNPGYMTLNILNTGRFAGFLPVGAPDWELDVIQPPWEIEIGFIPPADREPWNFFTDWPVFDQNGEEASHWQPGVMYLPGENKHVFVNGIQDIASQQNRDVFQVRFADELPESILAAKPLYMLVQALDASHVRVGFRAKPTDPWHLSETYDVTQSLDGPIGKLGKITWGTSNEANEGTSVGAPYRQKFLVDYIHYRYGLSTNK